MQSIATKATGIRDALHLEQVPSSYISVVVIVRPTYIWFKARLVSTCPKVPGREEYSHVVG